MSDRITRRTGSVLTAVAVLAGALAFAAPAGAQTPGRPITLEQAIDIALERNPTLRISENASQLDALTVKQQRMQFLPSLSLSTSTSQSYGRGFSQDEGTIINQTTNSLNGGLSSSVVLFNGQANRAGLAQAKLNEAASQEDVARSRQTVVFSVMSNFLALIEQEEQLKVQRDALASQEAQEAQIEAYVAAGSRPISDLYQQQATTASARLTLVQTQRALELARMGLVRTLYLDPLTDYEFVAPALTDSVPSLASIDLKTLSEEALARRADVAALESRVDAAEQSVRIASASRWPSVALTMGYNSAFTSANDATLIDQLGDRRGGSVGLSFSLPIFDRSASSIAQQRASIQVENARINLENARQSVAIEVRTAYLDLQSAQEQLRQAEAQLRAAELALQTSLQRYNVGAATLVELTQARTSQVRAASDLVNARYGLVFQSRLIDYYAGTLAAEGGE